MTGCSSYLLGGKICKLVPLRVLKPEMTAAKVVEVPFSGLKGYRSQKMTETVTILLHKNFYF